MRRLTDHLRLAICRTHALALAVVCVGLATTTGCWVPSVYPFYEDSDVVVDNTLVGQWTGEGTLKNCSLRISLKIDSKVYVIAASDAGPKSDAHLECDSLALEGKLVQVGQQRFIDLVYDDDKTWVTLDLLLKVDADKQKLVLTPLDAEWTANAIAERNVTLQGRIQEDMGSDKFPIGGVSVTLTSSTSELRDFLRQHGSDKSAFSQSGQMVFQRK